MNALHVGLVADPAAPTQVARRFEDLHPPNGADRRAWEIEVVSDRSPSIVRTWTPHCHGCRIALRTTSGTWSWG
jgi:hypothetical protein